MHTLYLKGKIVSSGLSVEELSKKIGMCKATFYRKLSADAFSVADVKKLIKELDLTDDDVKYIFLS